MEIYRIKKNYQKGLRRIIYQLPKDPLPDVPLSKRQLRTVRRLLKKKDGYAVVHLTESGPKLLDPSEVVVITAIYED